VLDLYADASVTSSQLAPTLRAPCTNSTRPIGSSRRTTVERNESHPSGHVSTTRAPRSWPRCSISVTTRVNSATAGSIPGRWRGVDPTGYVKGGRPSALDQLRAAPVTRDGERRGDIASCARPVTTNLFKWVSLTPTTRASWSLSSTCASHTRTRHVRHVRASAHLIDPSLMHPRRLAQHRQRTRPGARRRVGDGLW